MRAVRFELTHLSILELKSSALDHSAKLAGIGDVLIFFNIRNSVFCDQSPSLTFIRSSASLGLGLARDLLGNYSLY